MEAYLDVCIARCPSCGSCYAEAGWYALGLGADLECGKCGASFNAKKHSTDRALVRFRLGGKGKIKALELVESR
jgi:hypothetical protein